MIGRIIGTVGIVLIILAVAFGTSMVMLGGKLSSPTALTTTSQQQSSNTAAAATTSVSPEQTSSQIPLPSTTTQSTVETTTSFTTTSGTVCVYSVLSFSPSPSVGFSYYPDTAATYTFVYSNQTEENPGWTLSMSVTLDGEVLGANSSDYYVSSGLSHVDTPISVGWIPSAGTGSYGVTVEGRYSGNAMFQNPFYSSWSFTSSWVNQTESC